jgi:rubrerythrin
LCLQATHTRIYNVIHYIMSTNHICKCNNCDNYLIDENPQINAPEYNILGNEINMTWSETEQTWVCPICKTDAYLTDIENIPNPYTRTHTHPHAHNTRT